MKKIFFTDLDGTLLNKQKIVTSETRTALDAFVSAGGYFVICTGRALDSAQMVQKDLGLFYENAFLVGYNGAEIFDCKKKEVVRRTPLTLEQTEIVFRLAENTASTSIPMKITRS